MCVFWTPKIIGNEIFKYLLGLFKEKKKNTEICLKLLTIKKKNIQKNDYKIEKERYSEEQYSYYGIKLLKYRKYKRT